MLEDGFAVARPVWRENRVRREALERFVVAKYVVEELVCCLYLLAPLGLVIDDPGPRTDARQRPDGRLVAKIDAAFFKTLESADVQTHRRSAATEADRARPLRFCAR